MRRSTLIDQEDGLNVEDVRVQTLERMRRIFILVLIAVLFVYYIGHSWPQHAVLWLRYLGGKLGLPSDLDGPYLILAGIRAVFATAATHAFTAQYPFPGLEVTCGKSPEKERSRTTTEGSPVQKRVG